MKKFKLFISDLDGTLLTDDKTISRKSLKTIQKIREQGIIFAIATGRTYSISEPFIKQIGGEMPLILLNGGVIMYSESKMVFQNICFDVSVSKKIINLIQKHQGTFIFWQNDKVYISADNELTKIYLSHNQQPKRIYNKDFAVGNVSKFIWLGEPELEQERIKMLKEIGDLDTFSSWSGYLEVVPKGVNKGDALITLTKILNISLDEVIAMGDADNDVAMLKYAGVGATHFNAFPNAIKNADYIAQSDNNNNLICEVADKFIFHEN